MLSTFPSARRWLRKSPGQTLKRRAIPKVERPAPTSHSPTKIPSSPTTFHIHIISSRRRVQHLRPPHHRGFCLALTTTRLYHLQREPARLTSPSFAAQHLTFLSGLLNI